jgi:hypothetical protein
MEVFVQLFYNCSLCQCVIPLGSNSITLTNGNNCGVNLSILFIHLTRVRAFPSSLAMHFIPFAVQKEKLIQ